MVAHVSLVREETFSCRTSITRVGKAGRTLALFDSLQ